MPDVLATALAWPGLGWLVAAAFVAGTVRGFAGFGTAMIYMPVAAQLLDPFWAIITLVVMDSFGPIPNLPAVFRTANRRDLVRLSVGTVIGLPVGLFLLGLLSVDGFRITVSLIALVMLALLLSGVRYHGGVGARMMFATGGLAGVLGGVSGQPGPPVILLYMASKQPATVVRASTMAYLYIYDILVMVMLAVQKLLVLVPLILGAILVVPNLLGNVVGARIFKPGRERLYRAVAYSVIAVSALSGLPIWGAIGG